MWNIWIFFAVLFCSLTHEAYGKTARADLWKAQEISTEELKSWIDQGLDFILLDARGKKYDDGIRIPTAIYIPSEVPDEEIFQTLSNKDMTLVVYCHGHGCPASAILSDRLLRLGYLNVFEYPEGITGWIEAGNHTVSE